MAVRRVVCLVAIGMTLVVMGTLVAPGTEDARAASVPSSAAPVAIDLGGIFGSGSENEPDENETGPDAGGPAGGSQTQQSSGPSLGIVLLVVLLALAAVGLALRRLRRHRRPPA